MAKIFQRWSMTLTITAVVVGCTRFQPALPSPSTPTPAIVPRPIPAERFEASSGPCAMASDCAEVRYGCGKLVCTSEPGKYRELMTDCMVTPTPKDDGFACTCDIPSGQCGWVR